jgi:hypothetical protein
MKNLKLFAIASIVVLIGLSGCGTTNATPTRETPSQEQAGQDDQPVMQQRPIDSGEEKGSEEAQEMLLQTARDGLADPLTDDTQRQVLQNFLDTGQISEADWKDAVYRNAACLTKLSGNETTPVFDGAQYSYRSVQSDSPTQAELEAQTTTCYTPILDYVDRIWYELNRTGGPKTFTETEEAQRQCFIDKGLIPSDVTPEQWIANYDQYLGQQKGSDGQISDEAEECIARTW